MRFRVSMTLAGTICGVWITVASSAIAQQEQAASPPPTPLVWSQQSERPQGWQRDFSYPLYSRDRWMRPYWRDRWGTSPYSNERRQAYSERRYWSAEADRRYRAWIKAEEQRRYVEMRTPNRNHRYDYATRTGGWRQW
jgi:hypothetical protein